MRLQRHAICAAALLLPMLAQASNAVSNLSVLCSDTLSIANTDDVNWQCTGDLTLSGIGDAVGTLSSDLSITLAATGNMTLTHVNLLASTVTLSAGSTLNIDGSSVIGLGSNAIPIVGQPLDWTPGAGGVISITPHPVQPTEPLEPIPIPGEIRVGGNVSIGGVAVIDTGVVDGANAVFASSVPEPASWKLGLLGLLMMGWLRRRTR